MDHAYLLGSRAMPLRLREMTDEERAEVQRITRSHTLGAALVRRAQIVVPALGGLTAEEIATRMDLCGNTVRYWLNRFNARGLQGLEEDVRTGRPPTSSAEQRSAVITAALTRRAELGLPFACWTLDRLVAYLSDQGIAMRRSRISEIFLREDLKWRQDGGSQRDPRFGARVDPDFANKRGRSNNSTRRRRAAASSSAWTRWGHRRLRAFQASSL
jgi:transposase